MLFRRITAAYNRLKQGFDAGSAQKQKRQSQGIIMPNSRFSEIGGKFNLATV